MTQKKKIYLTEPKHHLYKEWLDSPPSNTEYLGREFNFRSLSKINLGQAFQYIKNKINYEINSHVVLSSRNIDLVHSNGSIIHNSRQPWIVDFESGCALNYFHNPNEKEKKRIKKSLEDKKCKKILPHSKAAKKGFKNHFNIDNNKIEVLYPSLSLDNVKNQNKDQTDTVDLCFVGRKFDLKGGPELIRVFKSLKKEYSNLRLHIISRGGKEAKNVEGVKHYGEVEREKVFEVMNKSDIFVYPTLRDTFGLVLLEAMAHKLPIITFEDYATNEIVEDGKNGFLCRGYDLKWFEEDTYKRKEHFHSWKKHMKEVRKKGDSEKVVNQLQDKLRPLIEDPEKRERMGDIGFNKIKNGKFSVENRNRKLSRIYEESLNV